MSKLNRSILVIMGLLLILTIAVRYASPIKDGDFYWHSAYAKYMLENDTLILDHTIFSWTFTDNTVVKCNWLAEILLYSMHHLGGLNLLFAFRYGCYLLVFLILIAFIYKTGKNITPLHLLIISVALFASSGASYIKPELFSFIYFSFLYFIYFNAKLGQSRGNSSKTLLFIPLIFLLWFNSHEVVLFGVVVFGSIYAGELLNYFFGGRLRPSRLYLGHLTLVGFGIAIAAFINPYGYKFPLKLLNFLLQSGDSSFGGIEAYHSIFFSTFSQLHYFDYWLIMFLSIAAMTAFTAWKEKRVDWAIVLPTLFLSLVYLRYVRATYYWPIFWAMSMFYLSGKIKAPLTLSLTYKRAISCLACILLVFLSLRITDTAIRKPFLGQFFGFGPGYTNPVQECDFLIENQPGTKLYNSYAAGGYLTYALYPLYKVFIDSRYFPYKSWYDTYDDFNTGRLTLKSFSEKYPFDVALVDYHYSKNAINEFLLDREDWRLVFYGTSGAVFVKKEVGFDFDMAGLDPGRFDDLRSIFQAYTVFNFAVNIGDWEAAEHLFRLMSEKFEYMKEYDTAVYLSSLIMKGMQAIQSGDYDLAYSLLDQHGLKPYMLTTNRALLQLRNQKVKKLVEAGYLREALGILEKTLSKMPEHIKSLYNAGVIGYILDTENRADTLKNKQWRLYLEKVISLSRGSQASNIAKNLLEGNAAKENIPFMF